MAEIMLQGKAANGRVVLVDDADVPLLCHFRWRVGSHGYAVTKVPTGKRGGRTVLMHRLLTGYRMTDHVSRDKLDNRRENLREAGGQPMNQGNRVKSAVPCSSRFKGVFLYRRTGRWMAACAKEHLGYFADEEQAARAYDAAAIRRFGEFARLNFPGAVT